MNVEHVDVVIVGAGLSGIGAACHLRRDRPEATMAILEARDCIGGTWDLFRYPGVRSDSDMYTLGYSFRPWTGARAIADGPAILDYVRDTAREYAVDGLIRFHHRVERAEWSSDTARWTVRARRSDTGEVVELTCSWLWVCSGYFRYDEGHRPDFLGAEDFDGQIVHPQEWPADLDYAGKQVVVVGSGATAVTLVPSMAPVAAHVTMLQRSPTYIAAVPGTDRFAGRVRALLPERAAYAAVRWKNVLSSIATYQLSRRRPDLLRSLLRKGAIAELPEGYDVDTHLAPTYDPWDQRLCAAPDGDFFAAIRSGRAEIVTDQVERFVPSGVRLVSGRVLPADVIVTATGLQLLTLGGMSLGVDGREVQISEGLAYKGMMLSGVPNLVLTSGYTNASWTLKADLVAHYVIRLLRHMQRIGAASVTPVAPEGLDPTSLRPLIELDAGYVTRSAAMLPRQGPAAPWRLHQNYLRDRRLLRHGPVNDEVRFGRVGDRVPVPSAVPSAR